MRLSIQFSFFFWVFGWVTLQGCALHGGATNKTLEYKNDAQALPPVESQFLSQENATPSGDSDTSCSYFYFLWGRHAELQLQFDEALEAYEKSLICDLNSSFLSRKIPLLLMKMNRQDEAQSWLERYIEQHAETSEMRMLLAKSLVQQNKIDQAIVQYKLLSQNNPELPAPQLLLAELFLSRNEFTQTRNVLEKMIDTGIGVYPAKVLMAQTYETQGEIANAIHWYRAALEENWSAEILMEIGKLQVEAEEYQDAISTYSQILEKNKFDENARIGLIHVYQLQDKEEQVLAELRNLRDVSENPARVDFTIARLHAGNGEYDKAIEVLEQLLEEDSLPEARLFLAQLYYRMERSDQALEQLQLISLYEDFYQDVLYLEVRILQEQDRTEEAVNIMEEMLLQPDLRSPELFVILAMLYQVQGKNDMVQTTYERAVVAYPKNDKLLYEYGLFLENSGDHVTALNIMQDVIALNPDNAAALNFVGYTWADNSQHLEQALNYIQKAVELKPEDGYIRDSLGWVLFKMGKVDQAILELEKAIKLSPQDAAIHDHLGDAYLDSGNLQKALEAYKQAEKLEQEGSDSWNKIQRKIRIIEKEMTL
ncbi:tetratricopeptide repeat protein [Desulfogranum japonicum]|uniref:tetratricopeptide repeat protein n=1 Tax=Desulfogranum japonicum TaxID=231447 RepID=UPI000417B176|nr:tetratricopeptide repeat protein [Desulfogranum japonicum]